jgi:hypothetical protein
MLVRIKDFLDSYSVLVAMGFDVVLVVLAMWLHASWGQWVWLGVAASLLLVVAGVKEVAWERRLRKRRARQAYGILINDLLDAASLAMRMLAGPSVEHIRVAIFFPKVKNNNIILKIRYSRGFEANDVDKHIEVPIGTGCIGQTWQNKRAMVADITELPRNGGYGPHWGLPPEEAVKVRPTLKCILGIPIWRTAGSDPQENSLVAAMTFDSDHTLEDMKFNDRAVQNLGIAFATSLKTLLSDMY